MSTTTEKQRRPPSLFGPIVLIAAGVFLLLHELNLVDDLYWGDLLRLWPLYLIFLGLNLLVLQAPRPLGSLLSGVIAAAAVVVAAYVLLAGLPGSIGGGINLSDWETEAISFAANGADAADMELTLGPPGANVYALEDSNDLIAGTVLHRNGVRFEQEAEDGRAMVTLAPRNEEGWMWLPELWRDDDRADVARWELGLSPDVPLSLSLTAAAGASRLDLRELTLEELSLDVAAGEATVFLPDGDYEAAIENNAAATTMTLPEAGEQTIELHVAAGSVEMELPAGMEARVEVDQALASFEEGNANLHRVGTSNVWQTDGYEESADRVTIIVDIAVGSVTLR